MPGQLHELVHSVPLDGILRIDAGLEGDWSGSVVPVWTADRGLLGFGDVTRAHPVHKPSLELYFHGAWVGVHCFRTQAGLNVFDEQLAGALVRLVEETRAPRRGGPGSSGPRGTAHPLAERWPPYFILL